MFLYGSNLILSRAWSPLLLWWALSYSHVDVPGYGDFFHPLLLRNGVMPVVWYLLSLHPRTRIIRRGNSCWHHSTAFMLVCWYMLCFLLTYLHFFFSLCIDVFLPLFPLPWFQIALRKLMVWQITCPIYHSLVPLLNILDSVYSASAQ